MKTNIIQLFQNCLRDAKNPRKLAPTLKYNLGRLLIYPRWDLDPSWLQPRFCLSFSKPISAKYLMREQDTPQVYQGWLWVWKNSETYQQLNKFNIGCPLIDLSRLRSWLITAAKKFALSTMFHEIKYNNSAVSKLLARYSEFQIISSNIKI